MYVVAWEKQSTGRLPSEATDRDGQLYIRSAAPSHSGTYICRAINQFTRQSQRVDIIVNRQTRPGKYGQEHYGLLCKRWWLVYGSN